VSKRGAAGGKAADKCNPLRGFTCPIQRAFHYPDLPALPRLNSGVAKWAVKPPA